MPQLNLTKIKKVYFIGIGGIGVSAITRMMALSGKEVRGSDMSLSEVTSELTRLGIHIDHGQSIDLIPKDTELVIYTIAIASFDPKLIEAIDARGIPRKTYPEILGIISADSFTIAISGTHGKTTTTAMTAKVFLDAGLDPTVVVGSFLKDQKSNFIAGKSKYFIVEACEYRRSFLNLTPTILVITNIDNDHLDYYKDMADIQSAFAELISKIPPHGAVICNPNDPTVAPVLKKASCKIIDYTGFLYPSLSLKVPGMHNRKNASAVWAVADLTGISERVTKASLEAFSGTWRRFEYKGTTNANAVVYDDYGHHPTEVEATLAGARELFKKKRIIVVFQPHLYSRTKDHLAHFGTSFKDADLVIISPIYPAREVFDPSITSDMVVSEINKNGGKAMAVTDFSEALFFLTNEAKKDDVIITMGAGDVYKIGESLLAPDHKTF